jgi:hypothetical protein
MHDCFVPKVTFITFALPAAFDKEDPNADFMETSNCEPSCVTATLGLIEGFDKSNNVVYAFVISAFD